MFNKFISNKYILLIKIPIINMSAEIFDNKIISFIVTFLKKENFKKICVKYDKYLFLFEINIQLKNNKWENFSMIYENNEDFHLYDCNSFILLNLKKNFIKYINKNKKYLKFILDTYNTP